MKQDKEQIQLTSTLPCHLPINTEEVVEALQRLEGHINTSVPLPRLTLEELEYQLKYKVRIPKGLTREKKREFILSAEDKVRDILVTGDTTEDIEGVLKELFSRNPKI